MFDDFLEFGVSSVGCIELDQRLFFRRYEFWIDSTIDQKRRFSRHVFGTDNPDFGRILAHELRDLKHRHAHQRIKHQWHDRDSEQRTAVAQLVAQFASEDQFYVFPLHVRVLLFGCVLCG